MFNNVEKIIANSLIVAKIQDLYRIKLLLYKPPEKAFMLFLLHFG